MLKGGKHHLEKIVDYMSSIQDLLLDSIDKNSPFYQFMESATQFQQFIKELSAKLQKALSKIVAIKDGSGQEKDIFTFYQSALNDLKLGNKTSLIEFLDNEATTEIYAFFSKAQTQEELTKINMCYREWRGSTSYLPYQATRKLQPSGVEYYDDDEDYVLEDESIAPKM